MKAILLAAGRGSRLYGEGDGHPHKALLRFDGQSLIARHVTILRGLGVEGLTVVVGYRAEDIRREITSIGATDFVSFVDNSDFHLGTSVSLWKAAGVLRGGGPVLFMDADVLYPPAMLARLLGAPHADCFLVDRAFEPGAEPVKLCVKAGRVTDFGKAVGPGPWDLIGEWPGFLTLAPRTAARLADRLDRRIDAGLGHQPMEAAVRDLALAPDATFGWEDVTGLPWTEIDFPDDHRRAEDEILPAIRRLSGPPGC